MINIAAAKAQIKDTVEAYLQKDDAGMYVIKPVHQRPIFMLGAPGIGKTAIMEQIAQELGIGMVSYSMTHHTRQSALGLPRIVEKDYEGFEYVASEYTMSEIVAEVYDYMERTGMKRGILFLDEINCVSETLYPSMLQFLQFKTFGKHKVPDDWVIVCAGNPSEYNRSVHEFDIVTLDRMRQIDVVPEYNTWKAYAHAKGLHPAVTSFLEARSDCFYRVESKPGGGKAFVTARGWEDLAKVIELYESMGKEVNRDLICQFLRHPDISDKFTVYYALFDKYRSDYKVSSILDGRVTEEIRQRARKAEFDERVALLSLMLGVLATSCEEALEQEAIVIELRDVLREAKPKLMAGGTVGDAIQTKAITREAALNKKAAAGTASDSFMRKESLVIKHLKDIVNTCAGEDALAGAGAFEVVQREYKAEVAKIQPLVNEAGRQMDNAFDFIDGCLGNREMLVFLAELTTRKSTTRYIAHCGNDKYYEHNKDLAVDESRSSLAERIESFDDLDGVFNDSVDGIGRVGLSN